MGNPRGARRDFEALAKRRLAAVHVFGKAFNNSEIGRRLKVCNQTVSRWRKQYAVGGTAALDQACRVGRKPRLRAADQERLVELLKKGPERLGYEYAAVDLLASGPLDREGIRRPLSCRARLETPTGDELECAAPQWPGAGAGRRRDPAVERAALSRH
jgi:transposase-like protein